jgi:putative inorganic carbon (hco3(-)) transporter
MGLAWLRHLFWLELPWIMLLGLPLSLPGHFLPVRHTPTLIFLLFLFWPVRALYRWRQGHPLTHPLTLPILALLALLPVSISLAPDLRMAWLMSAHLTLGIALAVALIHWPPSQRWPLLALLLILAIALALSLFGPPLLTQKSLLSPGAASFFRPFARNVAAFGETINANILAGGLVLAPPILLALALAPWHGSWLARTGALLRMLALCWLAWWLFQVILLTESRGALLATGCAAVVVLLLRWPRLLAPALLVALLLAVWVAWHGPYPILEMVMADGMARDYNTRMEIWVRSILTIGRHPFTGAGMGAFDPYVLEQIPTVRVPLRGGGIPHAHNLLLQVGVDLGLPGLLAYGAIIVGASSLLAQAWRQGVPAQRTLATAGLAALTALLVHGLLDAPLWNSKLAFLPWPLFALAVLLHPRHAPRPREAAAPHLPNN